jgi:hypothetical protein
MPQEPKRPGSELKPAELRTIVGEIQTLLWKDTDINDHEFWNADKECWREPTEFLANIADVLENFGLKPIDPPVVTGTTHKLDYEDEPIPEDYSYDPDPEHWTPHYRPPTS